jgi:putative ABC transport system ATP-binding protein
MAVLEIVELKKSYLSPDGQRLAVIDLPRLAVPPGAQVALAGASGSGKSTLLNLIAGILRPDSGSIRVAGIEITRLSDPSRDRMRARHIGYIFQTFNLLQGYTALENVELAMRFAGRVNRDLAAGLLERVGLKDRLNYRPRQLSVGQQQRVAVARALANHPELVLADEPTGNLDVRHAQAALDLIREMCRENRAALLLVSHDREVLAQFETVHEMTRLNRAAGSGGALGDEPAGDRDARQDRAATVCAAEPAALPVTGEGS